MYLRPKKVIKPIRIKEVVPYGIVPIAWSDWEEFIKSLKEKQSTLLEQPPKGEVRVLVVCQAEVVVYTITAKPKVVM